MSGYYFPLKLMKELFRNIAVWLIRASICIILPITPKTQRDQDDQYYHLQSNQILSFHFLPSSHASKQPACLTTSPAVTFSLSKVFIYQLPTDTLSACYSRSRMKKGTNRGRRSGTQADERKGGGGCAESCC